MSPRIWITVVAVLLLSARAFPQGFQDTTLIANLMVPVNNLQSLGRGPCWADFDRDGDQDMVMPLGISAFGTNNIRYYRNDGNGTFTDITPLTGLFNAQRARAAMAGDVDNDGDLDLFIAVTWAPDELWINDGNAVFSEEGTQRGVASLSGSFSACFGDYDRDGNLDLYVGVWQGFTQFEPNILYHNNGGGFFSDVTAAAGVGDMGLTFTGVFHDYDDDGWPDIFVGNDKGYLPGMPPNTTYRNLGNGTFQDVGATIGTQVGMGAMGSDFTDVFNDGGWDIYVSNTSAGHVFHRYDTVSGTYASVASTLQIQTNIEGWAVNWLDYDNDGWPDIYVTHSNQPNHLYRNLGWPGPWTNVAPALGADTPGIHYVSSVVDYDNDGRMDIFTPRAQGTSGTIGRLLRNNSLTGNWLRIVTVGSVSNRDGIGARITAEVGTLTMRRQVKSGTGYLACNDLRPHFGLGSAVQVDRLQIQWPSGQVQELWNVPANQELVVHEPRLALDGTPLIGTTVPLRHSSPDDAARTSVLYLSLGTSPGLALGDGRSVPGNLDLLGSMTFLVSGNPVFPQPVGVLDPSGQRLAPLVVPPVPALVGFSIHATGATLDPQIPAPWAPVRNILQPLTITLQ